MPDTASSPHPPPRFKLAALGIVGAAMVALPLIQVLRYQHTELQAALAAQAGLDPVARAVAVQHGLLSHRDVAGQVLRGLVALETERRSRERTVDERVAALAGALAVASDRTREEFDAMRDDWMLLARDVQQRSISAPASDLAHRLLIEQTLQVIDFAGEASGLGRNSDGDTALLASMLTRTLPRLAADIAALTPAGTATGSGHDERRLAATEAALGRSLRRLSQAVERSAVPRPALAAATAEAVAAADRYARMLRGDPVDAAQAGTAAVQAQSRLLEATRVAMTEALTERVDGARRERDVLLALTAALALLAMLLLGRIALPSSTGPNPSPSRPRIDLRRRRGEVEPSADTATTVSPHGSPTSRDEAGRLLQRLRGLDHGRRPARRRGDAPAETLPPDET